MMRATRASASLARFTAGLLALAAASAAAWLLVVALVPALFGWTPTVLTSGSMGPALRPGDVVVAAPTSDPLASGTVVVFEEPSGGQVSHRIVGVNPDGTYVTQGDANAAPDSTPVAPDRVVGRARLMVPKIGLPYVWWVSGAWGRLAAAAGASVLLAVIGWFGLGGRVPTLTGGSRRREEGRRPRGRAIGGLPRGFSRRLALRIGAVPGTAALLLSMLHIAPAVPAVTGARAAFTGNSANGSSAFVAAASFTDLYYLKTIGSGNTVSSPILPLSTNEPTATTLPNYDVDRDSDPGLLVKKGQYQVWEMVVASDLALSGPTQFRFWSAMKKFNTSKKGSVSVGLLDCADASWAACDLVTWSTLAPSTAWSGGSSGWVEKTMSLGSLDRTVAAGHVFRFVLQVDDTSEDALWFAYDTTAYPSRVEVG